MKKGKVLLWITGMAVSIGTVVWCEIDNRKRKKKEEEYWRNQEEYLNGAIEQAKALTEYYTNKTIEFQKGMEELCAAEVICPEIVEKLKTEGKWLLTEEDGDRYFTE